MLLESRYNSHLVRIHDGNSMLDVSAIRKLYVQEGVENTHLVNLSVVIAVLSLGLGLVGEATVEEWVL
jgi:uncharacterized membrane-anchored protein